MTRWCATPALARAWAVAAAGLVGAVTLGSPVLVVLTAPFLLPALLGLLHHPRTTPRLAADLGVLRLHEGQGTVSALAVTPLDGVEHVTRAMERPAYVVLSPLRGAVGGLVRDGLPGVEVGVTRWGPRSLGSEQVALTGAWAGFRWGPVGLPGATLGVLPQAAAFDSRAEAPQPDGLVGAHRSRRVGSGSEFSGIRPFAAGDRLRRIHWPVSLRTGSLQVVTTRSELDSGVLVVVDALRDIGRSGGVHGTASSLDLTVRAASALVEHHVRVGDRVGLRVLGPGDARVPFGTGTRHLHRLTGTLARVVPETRHVEEDAALDLGVQGDCVVYVLSPMLHAPVVTATATLAARGVPVLVIDTLGERDLDALGGPRSRTVLAWRMRRVERDNLLDRLGALGCPVVPWRGPGTVDDVLHRLARRAQQPRVRVR
ncbi:DUF58 domain-containing protein [Nocardioides sp. Soil805]|uniref:DUF58 domain-containing protein n=1 Tax=Nocardioides sp. Soil805 TaxID=1736416 RepID=UPI000703630E|nr:DUF58 domain-containing protein [Nocardioides sp. Soil805]KRF30274.1 hypothetical protein ASG94_19880 [Nocardioides sp. Soil805]